MPSRPFILLSLMLAVALCLSLFFALTARFLRPGGDEEREPPLLVLGVTHLAAALYLLPFVDYRGLATAPSSALRSMLAYLSFTVLLQSAARWSHFKALSLIDVALVSPFSALTPIFTVCIGIWYFGEVPTWADIAGITIVSLSLLGLHLGNYRAIRSEGRVENDIKILKIGVFFAFLSSVPSAFGTFVQKATILLSSPLTFSALLLVSVGTGSLTICSIRSGCRATMRRVLSKKYLWPAIVSGLYALNLYLFSYALTLDLAANISAMARVNIVFQILFAYWLAHQRERVWIRVFWAVCVFLGVLCIVFSS